MQSNISMKQLGDLKRGVLDHGFVRLVDCMGSDLSIVRAARVSYDANWRDGVDSTKDSKLIDYLLRNKHTSPFESVVFTFEIKCPIFIRAQWHRHRTWAYNEVSARYTELPEEFYVPDVSVITQQSTNNKQVRTTEKHPDAEYFATYMEKVATSAFAQYKEFLAMGCPRELARSVLPLSTYTRFFATVNLHNLFHFLNLRLHPHAQYEIRVYAETLLEFVYKVCPVAAKSFCMNNGFDAYAILSGEGPTGEST